VLRVLERASGCPGVSAMPRGRGHRLLVQGDSGAAPFRIGFDVIGAFDVRRYSEGGLRERLLQVGLRVE